MTQTALVTGGASGIGAAIAASMQGAGWTVISLDRAQGNAPGIEHHQADLTDLAATRAAAADIVARHQVTCLVHNAGTIRPALIDDANPEDIEALARLHLAAPLILLQATLPAMRAARHGRVVLMSSRAALGAATRSAYGSTKAGVIGLARTWALELAKDGITVNAIAPGPIGGTAMFHDVIPAGSERERSLAAAIPVGRLGRPEDVARCVLFLTDPAASFITGQTLNVCGGSSIGSLSV